MFFTLLNKFCPDMPTNVTKDVKYLAVVLTEWLVCAFDEKIINFKQIGAIYWF
jgi:hypothetical protein